LSARRGGTKAERISELENWRLEIRKYQKMAGKREKESLKWGVCEKRLEWWDIDLTLPYWDKYYCKQRAASYNSSGW